MYLRTLTVDSRDGSKTIFIINMFLKPYSIVHYHFKRFSTKNPFRLEGITFKALAKKCFSNTELSIFVHCMHEWSNLLVDDLI